MKIPEFKIRTDLALEEREGLKEAAEEVSGVSFKKWEGKRSAAQITEVKVLNEHAPKLWENRWEAILHWKQMNCLCLMKIFIVKYLMNWRCC